MSATDLLPGAARRAVWRLPAMLSGGFCVCAALVLVVTLAPVPGPLSALLAGVLLPAAAAPLLVVGNQLALDDERNATVTLRAAVEFMPRAARLGGVSAVPTALALVAWHVWNATAGLMWLFPAAVCAAVSVVALLLTLVVLPLAAQLPSCSDRCLFWLAVVALGRRPLPAVGSVALAAAGVWAATSWSASVLPLVPGPVVLALCAGVWTSVVDLEMVRLGDEAQDV